MSMLWTRPLFLPRLRVVLLLYILAHSERILRCQKNGRIVREEAVQENINDKPVHSYTGRASRVFICGQQSNVSVLDMTPDIDE